MMKLIFIFLDGTGIGDKADYNPFLTADPEILRFWEGSDLRISGIQLKKIDPLLGVEGIPQSATGQTTIFTGINFPKISGSHFGSFPNKQMRKTIKNENLLKKLKEIGVLGKYVNSFPMHSELFSNRHVNISDDGSLEFSDEFPKQFRRRISVTTSMIISNGSIPGDVDEMIAGESLYQDFSNRSLISRGLDIDKLNPSEAGEILFKISRGLDFTLYEYFQTDYFGHRKKFDEQVELIRDLDKMISRVIKLSDPRTDTILLTSDHGNIEDSRFKIHTRNYVPLLVWGKMSDIISENIESLEDITPVITELFLKNSSEIH